MMMVLAEEGFFKKLAGDEVDGLVERWICYELILYIREDLWPADGMTLEAQASFKLFLRCLVVCL